MASTPQRGSRRPTAQDVADLAGVSRSSVSLVLNGHAQGNVSALKQQAVLEAAGQLGYRPNALALSLRSRRSWILGVLTWRGVAGFPQEMLHASWQTATGAGYLTMLMDIPGGVDHDRGVTVLLDRQVDGIVIVAPELTAFEVPESLAGLPTMLINCFDPEQRVTSIVPDELGAAACATQILIDRGHTRISLLTDERPNFGAENRVGGVRQVMAAAGLELEELISPEASAEHGFALVRDAMAHPEPPTAVVATRERLALGALLAARDRGLSVPDDLSLISLDDGEQLSTDLVPKVATIHRPDRAMAEQGVAILLHEINSTEAPGVRQLSFVCPAFLGESVITR